MRKTKKLAALMLAGAMAASLAACGGQTASTDTQQRSPQTAKKAKRQSRQQTARPIRLVYYS